MRKCLAIDFIATDLLKVTNRRITDNWHIEDDPTLLFAESVSASLASPNAFTVQRSPFPGIAWPHTTLNIDPSKS